MTGKLIILTGAPESSRLDWTTPGLLLSTFQPSIAHFALLQSRSPRPPHASPAPDISVLDLAVWRTLPLVRAHIHTGFSQQHDLRLVGAFPSSADFLTTASLSLDTTTQQRLSQGDDSVDVDDEDEEEGSSRLLAEFYEHSLAVHADAASSQLVPGPHSQQQQQVPSDASFVSDTHSSHARSFTSDEGDGTTTTFLEGQDHRDDNDTLTTTTTPKLKTPLRPGWAGGRGAEHLSDLGDIPPAAYLCSIAPQTMTVSLVVGIISIAAPRAVATRFAGRTATLVEVLVGDDTKSGFAVTFWLNNPNQNQQQRQPSDGGGEEGVLAGLRGQDVVLMQNVALNAFRGKVYGASLRRDMTRVHLLYRARVDDGDQGGYYTPADLARVGGRGQERGPGAEPRVGHPQLEKTRRVRDWVLKFVGGGGSVGVGGAEKTGKQGRKRKGGAPPPRHWNQPPPLDSQ